MAVMSRFSCSFISQLLDCPSVEEAMPLWLKHLVFTVIILVHNLLRCLSQFEVP